MYRASHLFASLIVAVAVLAACQPDLDRTPNPFSFPEVTGVEPGSVQTSAPATISGIDAPVGVSVSGGDAIVLINGTVPPGSATVVAGDEVQVRITASDQFSSTETGTVTIGGISAEFSVTTRNEGDASAPQITSFTAATSNVLWGDEDVELAWSVTGDATALVLTNDYDASEVDVMDLTGIVVTVPSDVPTITYTLTATNDVLEISDTADPLTIEVELWVCQDPADVVAFADAALEQALRDMTDIAATGPITCAAMQALTEFDSGFFLEPLDLGAIESLAGIQHAVGLEELNLQVNLIQDVTPLTRLTSLRELTLDLNPVEDLAPLAGLTNLTLLSLWHLQDRDLAAFPYATDAYDSESCGSQGVSDEDLAALSGLVNLTEVYLSFNAITDLGPLADLDSLELLFVVCNAVDSLEPLAGKASLAVVWANDNDVDDSGFDAAATWASLQWLRLDYNRVRDLGPLSALDGLFAVGLEGNYLEAVAPLAANTAFPDAGASLAFPALPWPVDPTLSIGYNCLDTTVDDPVDEDVQLITARGVDVVGFVEAFQRPSDECDAFTPSSMGGVRVDPLIGPFLRRDR